MTSPLPPRNRDTVALADLIRQHKTNLAQTNVGFMGGRMPMLRPLGSAALFGDLEDDDEADEESEQEFVRFLNTDAKTAATSDATVTFPLTYEPIPGSLHVRQNGVDLRAAEWVLNGSTVTIPQSSTMTIRAGDIFDAAYAYDNPEIPVIEPASFIGASAADFGMSSIAIPDGVIAGDLLILAMNSSSSLASFSDPRFTDTVYTRTGGGYFQVIVGVADGSGSPIPISLTGTYTSIGNAALVAYRSATRGVVVDNATFSAGPYTLPSITATRAVGVLLCGYSLIPGSSSADSTAQWTRTVQQGYGADWSMHDWASASGGAEATPPGSFAYGGNGVFGGGITIELVGTP